MQQATTAEQSTVETQGGTLPGRAPHNAFVINLCSSTSPVALTPPDHAGLKRFSFFVSRRREESRERFRLHMGYFDTQEEAEKLLDIVREIYPGAWAGLAPGQRLRAAAAQAHASAAPTAAPEVAPAQLDQLLSQSAPAAVAAAAAVPARDAARAADAASSPTPLEEASVRAPIAKSAQPDSAALALVPDQGRRLPEAQAQKPELAAARSLNDVRAAIASLEDTTGERTPLLRPIPQLQPAASATTGHSTAGATGRADEGAPEISGSGVLAVLERQPRASALATTSATTGTTVSMAMPSADRGDTRKLPTADDAGTRSATPYYAVQLMWSVQPMDIAQVPQLAIFSAYTLYGAEGNRDGRRWYGLRLGFFTDAVSAKQVAHYVRSEFSTVSVVPVTARERERAKLAAGRPGVTADAPAKADAPTKVDAPAKLDAAAKGDAVAKATTPATPPKTGFEFIEDKERAALPAAKPGSGNPRPSRAAPGKRAKLRTQSGVNGRVRSKPMTLEETLEILGAGELKMDDGREPLINESGTARARPQPAKNKASRLGRLFERLSERIGS